MLRSARCRRASSTSRSATSSQATRPMSALLKAAAKNMASCSPTTRSTGWPPRRLMAASTKKSVTAGGALTVAANDDSLVHSNIKITGSAIASSDGGLHTAWSGSSIRRAAAVQLGSPTARSTDGIITPVAYGTTVGLDYDLVTDGKKTPLTINNGEICFVRSRAASAISTNMSAPDRTMSTWQGSGPADDFKERDLLEGDHGRAGRHLHLSRRRQPVARPDQGRFHRQGSVEAGSRLFGLSPTSTICAQAGGGSTGIAIVLNDVRGGAKALLTKATVDAERSRSTPSRSARSRPMPTSTTRAKGGGAVRPGQADRSKVAPKGVKGYIFKKLLPRRLDQGAERHRRHQPDPGRDLGQDRRRHDRNRADKVGAVTVHAENAPASVSENSAVSTGEGAKKAAALQIANNTIGWERSNLLFNTVETLLGDVVDDIAEPVGAGDTSCATASVHGRGFGQPIPASVSDADARRRGDLRAPIDRGYVDNKASAAFEAIAQDKIVVARRWSSPATRSAAAPRRRSTAARRWAANAVDVHAAIPRSSTATTNVGARQQGGQHLRHRRAQHASPATSSTTTNTPPNPARRP